MKTVEAGEKPIKYIEKMGTDYLEDYAVELPIYVNREGNLCVNRWEVPEATNRVLMGMYDGQFTPAADVDPIGPNTAENDLPENVKMIMSFAKESDFKGITANQKTK